MGEQFSECCPGTQVGDRCGDCCPQMWILVTVPALLLAMICCSVCCCLFICKKKKCCCWQEPVRTPVVQYQVGQAGAPQVYGQVLGNIPPVVGVPVGEAVASGPVK